MLDTVILTALSIWFAFFVVNYAELFDPLRQWIFPRLHPKLRYAITCPICFATWCLVAFSLFTGFTPLLLYVPPCCLLFDLIFNKLRDGCN
jgi:hypothetical protein